MFSIELWVYDGLVVGRLVEKSQSRLGGNPRPILHNYKYYIKIERLETFSDIKSTSFVFHFILFLLNTNEKWFLSKRLEVFKSLLKLSYFFLFIHFPHCWITPKHKQCVYSCTCKYFWHTVAFTSSPSESNKRTDVSSGSENISENIFRLLACYGWVSIAAEKKNWYNVKWERLFWYFSSTALNTKRRWWWCWGREHRRTWKFCKY